MLRSLSLVLVLCLTQVLFMVLNGIFMVFNNAIQCYSMLFDAIRRYSTLFNAIRRYSMVFNAIRCYLMLFNAIPI